MSGVPETTLWPLYSRAAEARRATPRLRDAEAERIVATIDYDFEKRFGKANLFRVLRTLVLDRMVRSWIDRNPNGTVVALGEGLETQFTRVDNGRVRWLSIDLPEVIEVRRQILSDNDRHRNLAISALDFGWMDEVDPHAPVFVTAAGLLMYFDPDDVSKLIATIAQRFPTAELAFDVLPRWFSQKTRRGWKTTRHYTPPVMPWALNRDELAQIKQWHPHIAELAELPMPQDKTSLYMFLFNLFHSLPWLSDRTPAMIHLVCRPA